MEDRENFEISTRGLKARCSASELPIQSGTPYQIRTDTEEILSLLPLPVGLREQRSSFIPIIWYKVFFFYFFINSPISYPNGTIL